MPLHTWDVSLDTFIVSKSNLEIDFVESWKGRWVLSSLCAYVIGIVKLGG